MSYCLLSSWRSNEASDKSVFLNNDDLATNPSPLGQILNCSILKQSIASISKKYIAINRMKICAEVNS